MTGLVQESNSVIFSSPVQSTESCCQPDIHGRVSMHITLQSFITKFFYVLGKALSDELSWKQTDLVIFAPFVSGGQERIFLPCTLM